MNICLCNNKQIFLCNQEIEDLMNDKHRNFRETTLKLIHRKGFKSMTMRDLAKEMKCDVSNIYNYTPSKSAFLEKVLFEINNEFQKRIDLIIASAHTSLEKLKLLSRQYVELSFEKPLELSLLINEWRNLKNEKLDLFIKKKAQFENKVRSIIEQGINHKELIDIDPDLATHLFLSSLRLLFDINNASSISINQIELERQLNLYIFAGLSRKS